MLTTKEATETILRERLSLTTHIFCVTNHYHIAEDVFQEICMKALDRASEFETPKHLLNWFRLCSRNRAIDILRNRESQQLVFSEETMESLEKTWDTDCSTDKSDLLDLLVACIEELTPRSKTILQMRYFDNVPGAEIARQMGNKVGSVYQSISRIHKSLQKCIDRKAELTQS
ncbi:RNA polymerase sigma factor [Rhodopirellula sallentina]|uniref:RNA polymerase, sigma-24 subunit, ECF subfamily n=1 Tax=Rhodopirellula sallentina SM41 TaxID=1263870 RepID=M5U6J5_9BACT|nr:sigma-70 family RNA polymerase sigma factor [Rhodopirellula sallentina]EMI57060.1 RNA polymerase, sigma-24 subunit, ECF subfamily [Rhodopirellula sallentina SM41]